MAFITALATAVATAIGVTSTIGVLLVKTAVTALVAYTINRSISKPQVQTGIDTGVRQSLAAATNHKIPVIYGRAYMGGIITDGVLTNSNKTMWMCLTISEATGALFSTGAASSYAFDEAYRNSDRIYFETDGITVAKTVDADGNEDTSMAGLIKIYMYAGSGASADQIAPAAASVVGNVSPSLSPVNAWSIFPNWSTEHNMSDLVFALVRVDYNRDRNVTSLGDYQFRLTNSMNLSGDVMFDYATNTRYGAGIRLAEISTGESDATTIARLGLGTYPWIDLS
jgi:hypothetical protein